MSMYRQDFQVLSCDVDSARRLRLSTLFTKLQEAAIAHTIELGITREKTLDQGLLWAVTQYHALFHRLPEYDEKVSLLSWPGKTMHLYFPRYFRLVDTKGSVLFEAVSYWVLIDSKKSSPATSSPCPEDSAGRRRIPLLPLPCPTAVST